MTNPESERSGFIRRNKGKIAAVTSVVAAVVAGPKAYTAVEDYLHPESQIVSGVPGQVEQHTWNTSCASIIKGACTGTRYNYFLGIEQCPTDVEAALRGQQTQSFNPRVGEIYENCYFDSVLVSKDTWQQFQDGATIVFEGSPTERLRK